ncbi:uncharacterized protein [Asterias amurensis]|uniref:uncharacterized protein n=1 Tax=Asterias amurensis TaxID=7602 RepID=UPI003AB79036
MVGVSGFPVNAVMKGAVLVSCDENIQKGELDTGVLLVEVLQKFTERVLTVGPHDKGVVYVSEPQAGSEVAGNVNKLISPVLADIFMEEFESSSLLTADLRPSLWLRYVDNTFVVWPHGQDLLHEFLQYLNQQHSSIKFTMEQEHSGKLPFLDVLITRNQDGTLHHSIYRKPAHTDRYLHQRSFHHPAIKSSVNRALVQRAYTICDPDSLQHELQHIITSLQRNGYNAKQVETSKLVPRPKGLLYPRSNTHTHS